MGIHVDGIENALLGFDRIDTVLHSADIVQAFQILGDAVAARAKELAPVYEGPARADVIPGELRDSIFAHAYKDREGAPAVLLGTRAADAPYGPFIEYGTEHNAAHPFLRPAADEMEGQLEDLAADTIAKLLAL